MSSIQHLKLLHNPQLRNYDEFTPAQQKKLAEKLYVVEKSVDSHFFVKPVMNLVDIKGRQVIYSSPYCTRQSLKRAYYYGECDENAILAVRKMIHHRQLKTLKIDTWEVHKYHMPAVIIAGMDNKLEDLKALYKLVPQEVLHHTAGLMRLAIRYRYLALIEWIYQIDNTIMSTGISEDENTPLQVAYERKDFDVLDTLYKLDPSILQHKEEGGNTPLMLAVIEGKWDFVQWILSKEPERLHDKSEEGYTIFIRMMLAHNTNACKRLYQLGSGSLYEKDEQGRHPCIVAIERGNIAALQICHGLNPAILSDLDVRGMTVMMYALKNKHQHIIEWLYTQNPDLLQRGNNKFSSPLEYAIKQHGDYQIVQWILQQGDQIMVQWTHETQVRCLRHLARHGQANTFRFIYKKMKQNGHNIFTTMQKEEFQQLLNRAVKGGSLKIVKRCWKQLQKREFGEDQAFMNDRAFEMFAGACKYGDRPIVEFLIQQDFEMLLDYGHDQLVLAAKSGHEDLVNWWIDTYPGSLEQDQGREIWMAACEGGNVSIVEKLYGAQEAFKLGEEGLKDMYRDGYFLAAKKGHTGLMEWFHKHAGMQAFASSAFGQACMQKNKTVINWFLETPQRRQLVIGYDEQTDTTFFQRIYQTRSTWGYMCPLLEHGKLASFSERDAGLIAKLGFEDLFKELHWECTALTDDPFWKNLRDKFDRYKDLPIKKFIFTAGKSPGALEGEALLAYYDKKIPDIKTIRDPYAELTKQFNAITDEQYLSNLCRGEPEEVRKTYTPEVVQEIKQNNQRLYSSLFQAIRECKEDVAIPKGKEKQYYAHLHKIVKRLALFCKKATQEEVWTYLQDLVSCAEHCYTHYSTILHNIYARISGDANLGQVAQSSEMPSRQFIHRLQNEYKQVIQDRIAPYYLHEDVHIAGCVINVFLEKGLSCAITTPVVDDHDQRMYALESLLQQWFEIGEDERDSLQDLRTTFATALMDEIKELIDNPRFAPFYLSQIIDKLLNTPDQQKSSEFLSQLTAWFEEHGIAADAVLEYDDVTGKYQVGFEGICKIWQALPDQIQIT